MASLSQSNKYLRNKSALRKIVRENCIATAAFEGASLRALKDAHVSRKRSDTASSKKAAKSS